MVFPAGDPRPQAPDQGVAGLAREIPTPGSPFLEATAREPELWLFTRGPGLGLSIGQQRSYSRTLQTPRAWALGTSRLLAPTHEWRATT